MLKFFKVIAIITICLIIFGFFSNVYAFKEMKKSISGTIPSADSTPGFSDLIQEAESKTLEVDINGCWKANIGYGLDFKLNIKNEIARREIEYSIKTNWFYLWTDIDSKASYTIKGSALSFYGHSGENGLLNDTGIIIGSNKSKSPNEILIVDHENALLFRKSECSS